MQHEQQLQDQRMRGRAGGAYAAGGVPSPAAAVAHNAAAQQPGVLPFQHRLPMTADVGCCRVGMGASVALQEVATLE